LRKDLDFRRAIGLNHIKAALSLWSSYLPHLEVR
jgi:hypothetical protein